MKKFIALSVLALALTGCAAKEEEAAAPAGCGPNEVVNVNDAGEQVCVPAEAPAAEAAPADAAAPAEAPAVEAVAEVPAAQ